MNDATNGYLVEVSTNALPIRTGPGTTYEITRCIEPGVHEISEERFGFGKLKSGAGWISLGGVIRI